MLMRWLLLEILLVAFGKAEGCSVRLENVRGCLDEAAIAETYEPLKSAIPGLVGFGCV